MRHALELNCWHQIYTKRFESLLYQLLGDKAPRSLPCDWKPIESPKWSACRVSNNLINQSRQDHYKQKLDGSRIWSKTTLRWQTAKELLHSKDRAQVPSEADSDRLLCNEFSGFFVNKTTDLKNTIQSKLHNLKLAHFLKDSPYHGQ